MRKKEQSAKDFDALTFFVYRTLLDAGVEDADGASRKIKEAFVEFPNWKRSDQDRRLLRRQVTFAIFAELDDLERVTGMVEDLFTLLDRAGQR